MNRIEIRCVQCGGTIREVGNTVKCDNCGQSEESGTRSPDPWLLVQRPDKYDSEASRRVERTFRVVDE